MAGVFSRNHPKHLHRLVRPGRKGVMRAKSRWSRAAELAAAQNGCPLYVATIGEGDLVSHAGILHQVLLDPTPADLEALVAAGVRDPCPEEALWDGDCQSLAVVELTVLDPPFSQTELIKASDGQPISADYGYSYCIVRER